MPQSAVFDCFSGIAGDMTLAALVDAGASLDEVVAGLQRLGLPPFALATEVVQRAGMRARYLRVEIPTEHTYQPQEMRAMVSAAGYPARVEERVQAAISALFAAEQKAHGTARPHFHEVGGVDAMVDLVGAMLAFEQLDIAEAHCPVVTVGSGTITRSEHGAFPAAPGPATAHILQAAGFALRFVESAHELVTPTGAAILAAVAKPGPAIITPTVHGCGAGTFDPPGRPNALRIFIGESKASPAGLAVRDLVQLEANIDDMSAALLAHARDRLMTEGALDAWFEPIGMKKGRPATRLCVLVPVEDEGRFATLILRETSTLGVRAAAYRRYEAPRHSETFASSLGPVRVKVRDWDAAPRAEPEYEDVKALAEQHGLPAIEVHRRLIAELDLRPRV
jgi:pyridinium-3,5-bisthiocarboxylic acid mononucleotide nickel chelatase